MDNPTYISALIMLAVAFITALAFVSAGVFLGPRRPNSVKAQPWDGAPAGRLPFKHQTGAALFIIMNVAIVLFIPQSVLLVDFIHDSPSIALFSLLAFAVLAVPMSIGLLFAYKRGSLR